jgi:hypothetical protein
VAEIDDAKYIELPTNPLMPRPTRTLPHIAYIGDMQMFGTTMPTYRIRAADGRAFHDSVAIDLALGSVFLKASGVTNAALLARCSVSAGRSLRPFGIGVASLGVGTIRVCQSQSVDPIEMTITKSLALRTPLPIWAMPFDSWHAATDIEVDAFEFVGTDALRAAEAWLVDRTVAKDGDFPEYALTRPRAVRPADPNFKRRAVHWALQNTLTFEPVLEADRMIT